MALLVAEDDATRMMREHRVRVTVKENYKYQKLSTLSGVTRDALPSKRLNCRKVSFSFGKKKNLLVKELAVQQDGATRWPI